MVILEIVILLVFALGLAFIRAKTWFWSLLMLVVIAGMSVLPDLHWGLMIPVWAIYAIVAIFANVGFLRKRLVTAVLVNAARKVLPPISQTEKEALDAGTVWWEGELFQGKPNWKTLHSYPKPTLTAEEEAFVENQTHKLCDMIDDWQIIHDRDLSLETWDYLKKEKFFGMLIPKENGGLGFSPLAQSTVVSKIATKSVSAAVTVMVPNSLGPAELILHYGTDQQKEQYLADLAIGKEIPCFALTAQEAGSDAGAMLDRGIVCKGEYQGKEVLGMRLTWDKRYITLCPVATVLGLAFKLFDPDHLLGDKEALGITCALIPTNHPGVETGKRHLPMYMAFMNGPTRGKDVFVPIDWIIGGPKMAGKGWRMLMECLAVGRAISLPALSTAAGKRVYRLTGAYSKIRKQFRVSIGKFEGVAAVLAEIAGNTYRLEACRVMTAGALSLGAKPAVASAIAKYHMTEMARTVVDHSMDIHSGRGIQAGPSNYIINGYLAMPIAITVEGANILTRSLMIFGQGSIRCHPYVYKEMMALMDEDHKRGLKAFDKLLVKHIGYGISNVVRSLLLGLSNAEFLTMPVKGNLKKYYQQLTRMSSALALVSDIALGVLGGELKRRESLSARLGDVLSHLYLSSAVLKYYHDHGEHKDDLLHVKWCVRDSLYEIQEALYGVFENFPNRLLGRMMRFLVFPYGRSYKKPSDRLSNMLADDMMKPCDFRNRLTQYCFVGTDTTTPSGRIEQAFLKMVEVEHLLKKMDQAGKDKIVSRDDIMDVRLAKAKKAGIISDAEEKELLEFEKLYDIALSVDEFTKEELAWHNNKRKQ